MLIRTTKAGTKKYLKKTDIRGLFAIKPFLDAGM
jgi:hypothetical protein